MAAVILALEVGLVTTVFQARRAARLAGAKKPPQVRRGEDIVGKRGLNESEAAPIDGIGAASAAFIHEVEAQRGEDRRQLSMGSGT